MGPLTHPRHQIVFALVDYGAHRFKRSPLETSRINDDYCTCWRTRLSAAFDSVCFDVNPRLRWRWHPVFFMLS